MLRTALRACLPAGLIAAALLLSAATPQAATSSQTAGSPDKALLDYGLTCVEGQRLPVGRLTLETLVSTYPSSPYAPKALLALAESWARDASPAAFEQARAHCLQLIGQYPDTAEAAQAASLLHQLPSSPAAQPAAR